MDVGERVSLFHVVLLSLISIGMVFSDSSIVIVDEAKQNNPLQKVVVLDWGKSFDHSDCGSPTTCDSNTTFYNGTYSCSSSPDWSPSVSFKDPVPAGMTVSQFSLLIYGRFNCNGTNDDDSSVIFLIQQTVINVVKLPTEPKNCSCPNCVTTLLVESVQSDQGVTGYNYGGTNTITLTNQTEFDVCLSYVTITIDFINIPQITNVFPSGGTTTGGTPVTLYGTFVEDVVRYACIFGTTVVKVESTQAEAINCNSPPLAAGEYNIGIMVVETGYIVNWTQQFIVYEDPVLMSVTPDSLDCSSNSNLTVIGENFTTLDNGIVCSYNGSLSYGAVLNKTAVYCSIPFDESPGVYELKVSLDHAHYTNGLKVYCQQSTTSSTSVSPITPPSPPPGKNLLGLPGFVYVIIIFGLLTIILGTVVLISKNCRKPQPDWEEPNSSARLLNSDGTPNNNGIFTKKIDFNDIKLLHKIGKGTFGEVYKGMWNGTDVGVKFLVSPNMNDQFLQDFYKEVLIMRSLRHPNILQFLGACTSPPNICIIVEYMPMGSLFKILHDESVKKLDLELMKRMMLDACRGMNYLHKSDPIVIHRDLKSHNLLVDENWKVKVCDFGLSKILETQADFTSMTACGTPSWTAPEILRNEKYTEKADIYSFGIVLWECMSREDPYYGMPPFQVVLAVGTKGMRPTIPIDCPLGWASLIRECWSEEPDNRPSFDDIMNRIEEL